MVARLGWELWRQKNHPGLLDLSPTSSSFFFFSPLLPFGHHTILYAQPSLGNLPHQTFLPFPWQDLPYPDLRERQRSEHIHEQQQ